VAAQLAASQEGLSFISKYYFHSHLCQSQSHIAVDSQSVGLSWCRTPSGAYDQNLFIYFSFETVTVFSMWAPSLTRGRVCRLSVSPLCDVFVRIIYNIFPKYIKYNRVKR
jgi:hypothetical protein